MKMEFSATEHMQLPQELRMVLRRFLVRIDGQRERFYYSGSMALLVALSNYYKRMNNGTRS